MSKSKTAQVLHEILPDPKPALTVRDVRCADCEFYEPPAPVDPATEKGNALSGRPAQLGVCIRFPATVFKRPDKSCGEHSRLRIMKL